MKTKKSSGRRDAGNIGLLIPMYVFTVLFVALPILYMFLLSFLHLNWIITNAYWNRCI